MKLPIFHKYFSVNTLIYIAIIELLLFVPILLFHIVQSSVLSSILFWLGLLSIVLLCPIHYYVVPFCIFLIPIEFYLRKTGRIIKTNVVSIPAKYQKYVYIITALIYIAITIVGIIAGQPMTEEELRYD